MGHRRRMVGRARPEHPVGRVAGAPGALRPALLPAALRRRAQASAGRPTRSAIPWTLPQIYRQRRASTTSSPRRSAGTTRPQLPLQRVLLGRARRHAAVHATTRTATTHDLEPQHAGRATGSTTARRNDGDPPSDRALRRGRPRRRPDDRDAAAGRGRCGGCRPSRSMQYDNPDHALADGARARSPTPRSRSGTTSCTSSTTAAPTPRRRGRSGRRGAATRCCGRPRRWPRWTRRRTRGPASRAPGAGCCSTSSTTSCPGSGIHQIYLDADQQYDSAWATLDTLTRRGFADLARPDGHARRAAAARVPVVVFNPLTWPRSGLVRVAAGRRRHGDRSRARDVPALGARVFVRARRHRRSTSRAAGSDASARTGWRTRICASRWTRRPATITRLYDKRHRREALAPGGRANVLQVLRRPAAGVGRLEHRASTASSGR